MTKTLTKHGLGLTVCCFYVDRTDMAGLIAILVWPIEYSLLIKLEISLTPMAKTSAKQKWYMGSFSHAGP